MLNFPDPAVTNPWIDPNGREWLYNGVSWSGDAGIAFQFTTVVQALDFTAAATDGRNILYQLDAPVIVTLDEVSGFGVGDVVTFVTATAGIGSTFIAGGTATIALPDGKSAGVFGVQSVVSAVYRGLGDIVLYGDLADV